MFDLQPTLENEVVRLSPLEENDFDLLYDVASDPLIWEQHPNRDRYKREVFQNFFEGAIQSKGAFKIVDVKLNKVIGSSRFYDADLKRSSVAIGYTFFARDHWGSVFNRAAKTLMLDHAFRFVEEVHFHIGAFNIRSQTSIQRLGALKVEERNIAYHGEAANLNFVYAIRKTEWLNRFSEQ
jgi:RimJ/RimL family protein N-acetyltransferase